MPVFFLQLTHHINPYPLFSPSFLLYCVPYQVEENTVRLAEIEAQIGKVSPNFRSMQQEVASLQRQILSVGRYFCL